MSIKSKAFLATDIIIFIFFAGFSALILTLNAQYNEFFLSVMGVFSCAVCALMAALSIIEILAAFTTRDATVYTVFVAFSLLFSFIMSDDMLSFFANVCGADVKSGNIFFEAAEFVFFLGTTALVFLFIYKIYHTGISRKISALLLLLSGIVVAAYVVLLFYGYSYIISFISVLPVIFLIIRAYKSVIGTFREDLVFHLTIEILWLFVAFTILHSLKLCGVINSLIGVQTLMMAVIVALFISIYVFAYIKTDKKVTITYKRYEEAKIRSLRAQIRPHFIFNTLSSIKALYRMDIEEGDRAMDLFSKHLRANVDSEDKDLVPFEKELDNLATYTELENLRLENKFNIIFDIDATDFLVPVLSLQPYVENAIKYSRANEKPDGYVKISSYYDGDSPVLEISDNGVGFDHSTVKPTSFGIKNSYTRFKLLMGVEPIISSTIGKGTKITVRIPRGRRFRL